MKRRFCQDCLWDGLCENQDRDMKCEHYSKQLEDMIERIEKQLKEANVVITSYIRNNPLEKYGPAEAYCERWGVK